MGSLFLIRHATTDASAGGRNLGQRSDPPLAAVGEELARRLGAALALELAAIPVDEMRIVTSSALRCRQTAALARDSLRGAPEPEVSPALLELDYGDWEGLTHEECRTRDPDLRRAWEADPYATRCPNGESGGDVVARSGPVLDGVESWLAERRGRCALVVSHHHVIRTRIASALGLPTADYRRAIRSDPGSYSMITAGGHRPVIRRINATPPDPAARG